LVRVDVQIKLTGFEYLLEVLDELEGKDILPKIIIDFENTLLCFFARLRADAARAVSAVAMGASGN